ncbi:MAG: 30S ribosomal protein S21 [Candidatus Portnoybacteria bacterium]|nr:30S ribosomal protein S21 [Candidatus Portnoybacteria bacterium]
MVEVQKQPKENIGSMLRRFSERVKKSGILIEARESKWYKKPQTKRARRLRALVKAERQTLYKTRARQM